MVQRRTTMSMNVTITTYHGLDEWVDAFMKEKGLRLLFLVGNPGASKSHSIKAKLDDEQHRYFKCGRLTAFQLFKQLWRYRNKDIILDDVEDALKKEDRARILMNLCETDEDARTVAWFGSESMLKVRKGKKCVRIPQEFKTSSRVCLVSNDWDILLTKFQALLDRGTVVFFDPPPEEIHAFVQRWFQDQEIYAFVGNHLDDIPQHSIRYYVIAQEHKRLGLDWQKALQESWRNERVEIDPEKVIEMILTDARYQTDKERIKVFESRTGLRRRQWYYLKKKVMKRKPGLGYFPKPVPQPPVDADLDRFQPEEIPNENR